MLWQTCSEAWQRLRTGWLRLKCMRMGWPHKPAVALVLDRTWCTCFEMRLPMALQTQDVWFQLQAEAAARAAQDVAQSTSHSVFQAGVAAEPMALDYTEAITRLNRDQIALEAAQSSFAKISQLSLFQYIN